MYYSTGKYEGKFLFDPLYHWQRGKIGRKMGIFVIEKKIIHPKKPPQKIPNELQNIQKIIADTSGKTRQAFFL